jgi:hypothetical protein
MEIELADEGVVCRDSVGRSSQKRAPLFAVERSVIELVDEPQNQLWVALRHEISGCEIHAKISQKSLTSKMREI